MKLCNARNEKNEHKGGFKENFILFNVSYAVKCYKTRIHSSGEIFLFLPRQNLDSWREQSRMQES
jgi:hypothetical protein